MKRLGVSVMALTMLGGAYGASALAQSKGARAQSNARPAVTQVRMFEGVG